MSDTRKERAISTLLAGINVWTWYLLCLLMYATAALLSHITRICLFATSGLKSTRASVMTSNSSQLMASNLHHGGHLPETCRVGVGSPALKRRIGEHRQIAREWYQCLAYHHVRPTRPPTQNKAIIRQERNQLGQRMSSPFPSSREN